MAVVAVVWNWVKTRMIATVLVVVVVAVVVVAVANNSNY